MLSRRLMSWLTLTVLKRLLIRQACLLITIVLRVWNSQWNRLRKLKHLFLNYVVRDSESQPRTDSTLVRTLWFSASLSFFVFIINFVVIIGTDSKFGVDLSTQAAKSYNTKTRWLPSVGRFTTEMECFGWGFNQLCHLRYRVDQLCVSDSRKTLCPR